MDMGWNYNQEIKIQPFTKKRDNSKLALYPRLLGYPPSSPNLSPWECLCGFYFRFATFSYFVTLSFKTHKIISKAARLGNSWNSVQIRLCVWHLKIECLRIPKRKTVVWLNNESNKQNRFHPPISTRCSQAVATMVQKHWHLPRWRKALVTDPIHFAISNWGYWIAGMLNYWLYWTLLSVFFKKRKGIAYPFATTFSLYIFICLCP